jgi:hypothetical protein
MNSSITIVVSGIIKALRVASSRARIVVDVRAKSVDVHGSVAN